MRAMVAGRWGWETSLSTANCWQLYRRQFALDSAVSGGFRPAFVDCRGDHDCRVPSLNIVTMTYHQCAVDLFLALCINMLGRLLCS